jgi:hypothetical protein
VTSFQSFTVTDLGDKVSAGHPTDGSTTGDRLTPMWPRARQPVSGREPTAGERTMPLVDFEGLHKQFGVRYDVIPEDCRRGRASRFRHPRHMRPARP